VHRVGRTARAGRGGGAVSLVTQYDVKLIQSIETLLGRQLEELVAPEDEVLKGITKVRPHSKAAVRAGI
jgi:ATP-dependent RNA helicase DDX49/DBP8